MNSQAWREFFAKLLVGLSSFWEILGGAPPFKRYITLQKPDGSEVKRLILDQDETSCWVEGEAPTPTWRTLWFKNPPPKAEQIELRDFRVVEIDPDLPEKFELWLKRLRSRRPCGS